MVGVGRKTITAKLNRSVYDAYQNIRRRRNITSQELMNEIVYWFVTCSEDQQKKIVAHKLERGDFAVSAGVETHVKNAFDDYRAEHGFVFNQEIIAQVIYVYCKRDRVMNKKAADQLKELDALKQKKLPTRKSRIVKKKPAVVRKRSTHKPSKKDIINAEALVEDFIDTLKDIKKKTDVMAITMIGSFGIIALAVIYYLLKAQ